MSNAIITVLIPVYNSETTILRCIKSITEYTDTNLYEILVIDDGSQDDTYRVVEDYSRANNKVRVFSRGNMGVSKTRQELIEKANTEYIMFCDADDYFEPGAIDKVLEILSTNNYSLNIIFFGFNFIQRDFMRSSRKFLKEGIYRSEDYSKFHVAGTANLFWSSVCNKCYKRDLLLHPKIIFEELLEDVIFNVEAIGRCCEIYISNYIIYNYVQIGNSLTRGFKKDTFADIDKAYISFKTLKRKLLIAYPNLNNEIQIQYLIRLFSLLERSKAIGFSKFSNKLKKLNLSIKL